MCALVFINVEIIGESFFTWRVGKSVKIGEHNSVHIHTLLQHRRLCMCHQLSSLSLPNLSHLIFKAVFTSFWEFLILATMNTNKPTETLEHILLFNLLLFTTESYYLHIVVWFCHQKFEKFSETLSAYLNRYIHVEGRESNDWWCMHAWPSQ